MPTVRTLLDMAMELGDTPDSIHPSHKQNLATGSHALGGHPAFPAHQGQGENPHEKLATGTYKNIIAKLQQFGGVVPRAPRDVMRATQDMFATLASIQQREEAHREQLEQLAVEAVLRLPEFKTLRPAIQNGQVKIEAHLNRRIEIQGGNFQDTERPPMPDAHVPEIAAQYQQMIQKRKLHNTFAHGAAVANNYSIGSVVFDELCDIDRTLARDYGKFMAYTELGYFVQSKEIMRVAAEAAGSELQAGQARIKRNEDGSATIYAAGITFSALFQEIIKGCMQFLAWADEDDPDTAHHVRSNADFVEDEMIQMQVGPQLYRQFTAAIGQENIDLMPYIYDEMNRLPTDQYNRVMQGLVNNDPQSTGWFRNLAQKIRQEQADGGEQQESLVDRILGH